MMGGTSCKFEGKEYNVHLDGGCMKSCLTVAMEAFERWLKTEDGKKFFRFEEDDGFDSEHYLSEQNPVDPETRCREDEDDIKWGDYEKCSHGCHLHFWYSGDHDCCLCDVISCKQCAKDGSSRRRVGCDTWICDRHKDEICPDCREKKMESDGKKRKNIVG